MKKQILTVGILCMLGAVGCSSGVSQEQYESVVAERDEYKAQLESFNNVQQDEKAIVGEDIIEESDDDIEIINTSTSDELNYVDQLEIMEHYYINSIKHTVYCMVIKNNSDKTLKISANITAKDSDGNLVGAGTVDEYAVQSGYTIAMRRSFDNNDIAGFDYSISASVDDYNDPVLSDIEMQVSKTDKKAIISCTNKGSEPALFVQATALFYKNGEVINSGSTYCVDDSSKLKPGDTIVKEINAYQTYDNVEVYLTGRR